MANKRLPDNVHKLKNTLRKDRHGDPETKVKIDTKLPEPPGWIKKDARKEWCRICKVMEKVNVLTEADVSTLAQYCTLYAELLDQKEEFTAAKHTQLRLCAVELGFTPVSRSKITVGKVTGNDFDDL